LPLNGDEHSVSDISMKDTIDSQDRSQIPREGIKIRLVKRYADCILLALLQYDIWHIDEFWCTEVK
jgi:hypothetical protein